MKEFSELFQIVMLIKMYLCLTIIVYMLLVQWEQVPSYLSLRKEFSVKSQQNGPQGSGSTGKPPESGTLLSKFVIGSVALGAAFVAAYQTGYLDKYLIKEPLPIPESSKVGTTTGYPQDSKESNSIKQDIGQSEKPITESSVSESNVSTPSVEEGSNEPTPNVGHSVESIKSHSDLSQPEDLSRSQDDSHSQVSGSPELTHEDVHNVQVKDTSSSQHSTMASDDAKSGSTETKESFDLKSPYVTPDAENTPTLEQDDKFPVKNEMSSMPTQHVRSQSELEVQSHLY